MWHLILLLLVNGQEIDTAPRSEYKTLFTSEKQCEQVLRVEKQKFLSQQPELRYGKDYRMECTFSVK